VNAVNETVFQLESIRCCLGVEEAAASLQEMASVLVDLEADKIGTQHAFEELLSNSQTTEDLRRRESDVEEEPNLGMRELLADHARDQEQMVVMDPNYIATFPVLNDAVCKGLVDVDIVLP
jgi:hypothetical protein